MLYNLYTEAVERKKVTHLTYKERQQQFYNGIVAGIKERIIYELNHLSQNTKFKFKESPYGLEITDQRGTSVIEINLKWTPNLVNIQLVAIDDEGRRYSDFEMYIQSVSEFVENENKIYSHIAEKLVG